MKNKTFILLFFIGSFLIFLILPIFNYFNDQWRVLSSDYERYYQNIEPNKSFLKTKYLLENKDKYDTLLMGSSRIGNLDSKLISDKAYNMTYSFGHISSHLNNLKILLNNDVKIKRIILGIDDFYLFKNPKDFETDYLRKLYKDDLIGKIDFYKFYLFKKPKDRDIDIFFNKYQLIKSNHIIRPDDMRGRINREHNILNDLNSHKKKLENPILLGYNENFRTEQVLKEIKEFKELCELHNVELITIMFPQFYNVYLSYNQDEIEKFKEELVKITEFHDFYLFMDYSFDEKLWFDTSHFVPTIGNNILYNVFENKNLVTINNIRESIKNSRKLATKILDKDLYKIIKFNNLKFEDLNQIFDIKQNNYFKNEQLELNFKNGNYNLNAIKNDPIIILNQTKSTSKNVILSYEIESSIDTTFQLFYKKEPSSSYNEIDSYKVNIKKGNNKINLLLPSEYLNNELRLDLVSHIGNYKVKSLKIYIN